MVDLKILKGKKGEGLSVYLAKKNIIINSDGGAPMLELTNEYGNTLRYEISDSNFNNLHASLWQFVKDSQH